MAKEKKTATKVYFGAEKTASPRKAQASGAERPRRKYTRRKKPAVLGEEMTSIQVPTRLAFQIGVLIGQQS